MPSNVLDLRALDAMSRAERLEFERGLVSSSSLSDDLLSRLEGLSDGDDEEEEYHGQDDEVAACGRAEGVARDAGSSRPQGFAVVGESQDAERVAVVVPVRAVQWIDLVSFYRRRARWREANRRARRRIRRG